MKKIFSILLIMILSFSLFSCGSEEGTKETSTNFDLVDVKMPKLEDSRGSEEKIVTFTDLNGNEHTYNQNTRRIVCTFGSQDVVGFGIKLLAYEGTTDIEGYESYYEGSKKLTHTSPLDSEELMSYDPDIILTTQSYSLESAKTLKKVTGAEIIPLFTDSTDFETRLSYIGNIFGLKDNANKLIDYSNTLKNSMINEMNKLDISNKTLTIFTYMGSITIPPMRGWFMNTIAYDYLGLKCTDKVKDFMTDESVNAYGTISSEKLYEYEGDLVIFANLDGDGITSKVTANPGWQVLNAVRENRVGILDTAQYAQKGVILLYKQYVDLYNALKVASAK